MLTLRDYAELVTREVRRYLPNVRASRSSTSVTWRLGDFVATLDASKPDWWHVIHTAGPQPVRTHDDRHDVASAHVAASNIVVHFDPCYCRGIDAQPYSDADMRRIRPMRP